MQELAGRVRRLEEVTTAQAQALALNDLRTVHATARFDKIEQTLSRIMWLIITGIAGGVMSFIMQGGLNAVGG